MSTVNDNFGDIRKKIDDTEADINKLNEEINSMSADKAAIDEKYATTKEDYENYKGDYTYQSSNGNYFLIVSGVVFVVVLVLALNNSIPDFFLIPSAILFAVGIALKALNAAKFKKMSPVMAEKEATYKEVKTEYDEFTAKYNETAVVLEKKQYEWELFENDMIEARKEEWIAKQKATAAN